VLTLIAVLAGTPLLRLLADETAKVPVGIIARAQWTSLARRCSRPTYILHSRLATQDA